MPLSWKMLAPLLAPCALFAVKIPASPANSFSFTTIDAPGDTAVQGITDAGQIVGNFEDTGGNAHGFVRTPTGAITAINVAGATSTRVKWVNGTGQIVGTFTDVDKWHLFLRAANGVFTTIDFPSTVKTTLARATGINDAGQIVGFFGDLHSMHGFSLTAAGALTIIDVPGATNTLALGLTNAGQIVGGFEDASRKSHGFVTTR